MFSIKENFYSKTIIKFLNTSTEQQQQNTRITNQLRNVHLQVPSITYDIFPWMSQHIFHTIFLHLEYIITQFFFH